MRLVLGLVCLLLVLGAVAMLARTQLGALQAPVAADGAASAAAPAHQQIQRKIQDDVTKLMQTGPTRGEPTQ
jgi:hypothetical protein